MIEPHTLWQFRGVMACSSNLRKHHQVGLRLPQYQHESLAYSAHRFITLIYQWHAHKGAWQTSSRGVRFNYGQMLRDWQIRLIVKYRRRGIENWLEGHVRSLKSCLSQERTETSLLFLRIQFFFYYIICVLVLEILQKESPDLRNTKRKTTYNNNRNLRTKRVVKKSSIGVESE